MKPREIRFRAWNKLVRKMDYSPMLYKPNKDIEYCFLNEWIQMAQEHMNGIVLMQFTGFTDCKGREIWEGDIVMAMGKKTVIEHGDFAAYPFVYSGFKVPDPCKEDGRVEVLGNVYEHPHLLEPGV